MNMMNRQNQTTPEGMDSGDMRRSGSSGNVVIFIIIILVIAGGAGVWYFMSGTGGKSQDMLSPSAKNETSPAPQTTQTPVYGGETASDPAVESIANVTPDASVSGITKDLDETDLTSVDTELDAIDKAIKSAE